MTPLSRVISIIAYLFIFLPGWMIAMPFVLYLFAGLGDEGPMRLWIALADAALLTLFCMSFDKRKKWTLLVELIIFIFLTIPIILLVYKFPEWLLRLPVFYIPAGIFIVLFPLSIVLSHRRSKQESSNEAINLT